ncbi:hypothetical protein SAMN05444162_0343 [Paenibacillaceae bacterium GAS479]|nr:hypothetical protein SAMN05444162_0343 [Paenibacillaceae bacterium GAS479]
MNAERAVISNFKGSSIGMILVLFILLVIVTSFFSASSIDSSTNPDFSITSSRAFRLVNESSFSLKLTAKNNQFEPPGPPLNTIISEGSSYGFEVQRSLGSSHAATATFEVILGPYVSYGTFDTRLYSASDSNGGSNWSVTRSNAITVTYDINGTTLTIRNSF